MAEREQGDVAGFCQRVQPRLVASLALYLGDRGVAEEVAQEALVRAWERWSRVSAAASPEAWVFRVALNLSNSLLRRRVLERRHLRRIGAEDATDGPDPTDRLAVRQAVAGLPPRQRAAVVLRYLADFSVAETAEAMHCAPGTVKALTAQARASLSTLLEITDSDEAGFRG